MTVEYVVQCPHCQGTIRLTVDADEPEIEDSEEVDDEDD